LIQISCRHHQFAVAPVVTVRAQLFPTRTDTIDCVTLKVPGLLSWSPQSGSCHHSVFLKFGK